MTDKQKELNNRIAIELDKHCIQNEYGYMLLDQDKDIRDKYKWCFNISWPLWVDIILALLPGIIGLISNLDWLIYIGVILFFVFATFIFIRYSHRRDIARMLEAQHRKELSDTIEKHSEYVDKLREWFMEVGADKKTDRNTLIEIAANFKVASRDGNKYYNKLSSLFGKMQPDLHEKARQKAEAKLFPLLQFHIK